METGTSCESLVAGSKKLAEQPQPATPDRKHGVSCLQHIIDDHSGFTI